MSTETPRTDAFEDTCGDYEKPFAYARRLAAFTRTLERELIGAQAELEAITEAIGTRDGHSFVPHVIALKATIAEQAKEIERLRAQIAAPAQEPVAWRYKERINCGQGQYIDSDWKLASFRPMLGGSSDGGCSSGVTHLEPLYAAPQPDEARDAARLSAMLLEARNEIEYLSDNEHPILARIDAAMQQTSGTEG